jgi:hypothetical protein
MKMRTAMTKGVPAAGLALLIAGCNASGNPFSNPFGSSQPRQQLPVVAQPAPAPAPVASAGTPSVVVSASPKRVQDTIVARAQRRGTNVLGANNTGVTLEIPLRQSSDPITQQCGAHKDGRAIRVYLETVANGANATTVNEQKFIVDGATVCNYTPNEQDVADSNRALGDLKREAEQRRTASASGATSGGRPAPSGGLEAVDPRRPVRPLQ